MCSIHTMVTPDSLDVPYQLNELGAFGLGQAAGDFVEQQQPRRARQGTRQFEPLASQEVERAGAAIGKGDQAGAFENVAAGIDHLRLALPAAMDRGDQKIFEHGEVFERMRNLKRSADAGDAAHAWRRAGDVASVKSDRAGIRLEQAGDEIEQRRFAGAVRADDAERLARRDFKLDVIDGFERAERSRQIIQPEDHATVRRAPARRGRRFYFISCRSAVARSQIERV